MCSFPLAKVSVCVCVCVLVPFALIDYWFVSAQWSSSPNIQGISKIIYGKSNEQLVLTCEGDAPVQWHMPNFLQVILSSAQWWFDLKNDNSGI